MSKYKKIKFKDFSGGQGQNEFKKENQYLSSYTIITLVQLNVYY